MVCRRIMYKNWLWSLPSPNHTLDNAIYGENGTAYENDTQHPIAINRHVSSAEAPDYSTPCTSITYEPIVSQGIHMSLYIGQVRQ